MLTPKGSLQHAFLLRFGEVEFLQRGVGSVEKCRALFAEKFQGIVVQLHLHFSIMRVSEEDLALHIIEETYVKPIHKRDSIPAI